MFRHTTLLILLTLALPFSVSPKKPKYNRYEARNNGPRQESAGQTPADLATSRSSQKPDELAQYAESLYHAEPNDAEVEGNDEHEHGPLGSVCAEFAQYCSYFARNIMADAPQRANRDSLLLFCNVMKLLADLADAEVATVRSESYTSDVIHIMTSMKNALKSDTTLMQNIEKFPLLHKLATVQDDQGNQIDDELGIYMHNVLRTPEMAQPILKELFAELNVYAQEKAHVLLSMFHQDSRKLLDLTMRPLGSETRAPRNSAAGDAQSRHQHQMSWLCHHAAEACVDIAESLKASPTLKLAAPLVSQIQSMMSAMSLTYNHLSADPALVRAHDRHAMATHFACMIHLLPETAPTRGHKHSPQSAYLDKCTELRTVQDKQHFVEEAFSSELDRDALLAEFFPAFESAVDYNLDNFSTAIGMFTVQTFANRYWKTNA